MVKEIVKSFNIERKILTPSLSSTESRTKRARSTVTDIDTITLLRSSICSATFWPSANETEVAGNWCDWSLMH